MVEAVHFPDLRDVVVRSATTGELAHPFHTDADGYFSGLVVGAPGENRIEIVARADDGTAARREIAREPRPERPAARDSRGAEGPAATRCSKSACEEMRDAAAAREREQAERVRRELRVEIEREREKARARAAEQRKQLRLDLEPEPE